MIMVSLMRMISKRVQIATYILEEELGFTEKRGKEMIRIGQKQLLLIKEGCREMNNYVSKCYIKIRID